MKTTFKTWAPATVLVAMLVVALASVGFGQGAETTVSFANDIVPMFVASCTSCHTGEAARTGSANLNLDPEFAYGDLIRVMSGHVPTMARVMPGDPDASYLVHKLAGTQADVGGRGQRMPRGSEENYWTDEQIELVRTWIAEGAQNN